MIRKLLLTIIIVCLAVCPSEGAYRRAKAWENKPPVGSQIDWTNPITNGLVGCWIMNEGSGNVVRDIAKLNDGVLTSVNWGGSVAGIGTNFNVSTGNINCGKKTNINNLSKISAFSIFYPRTFGGGGVGRLFDKDTASFTGWDLNLSNTGSASYIGFFVDFADASFLGVNPQNGFITLNAINKVLVTYDGGNSYTGVHLYNNGIEATSYQNGSSGTGARADDSGNNLYIGQISGGTSKGFDGFIFCAFVWNRVLTPKEAKSISIDPYQFIIAPKRRIVSERVGGVTATPFSYAYTDEYGYSLK